MGVQVFGEEGGMERLKAQGSQSMFFIRFNDERPAPLRGLGKKSRVPLHAKFKKNKNSGFSNSNTFGVIEAQGFC